MIDRAVLFNVFDRKGPVPIFFEGLNEEEARFIALRSQMTLSQMSAAEVDNAEAILPFSNLGKIAFILLFQTPQADSEASNCTCFLAYIVPQEKQVFLYSKVPFLKLKADLIITELKNSFIYSGSSPLSPNLKNLIKDWNVTEKETTTEIQIIEKKVTLSEKREGGSIEFFLSQVRKDEERAIGALFRSRPVFVTGGSEVLIDLVVHSLDFFVPHASLRKISYTESIIDPSMADIIGISKNIVKNYPNEVIIELDKKQVKNGKPCIYSKNLIKLLRKNPEKSTEIVKKSTNKLLRVAGQLIEVFSQPEEQREEELERIRKSNDPALVEVAAEIGAQRNPLIKELLLASVSNRFIDWMDTL
ncbi:hypothetical protein [Candidatus Hodarchaeum mangrovi]